MTAARFRIGRVDIALHPLALFSVLALVLTENTVYSVGVLLCAVLHEAGHIAALYRCGGKLLSFSFLPCGLEIGMSPLSYKKEIIVALCGPLANAAAAVLFSLAASKGAFLLFCVDCNAFLALFNLLPLCGFDGALIVRNLSFLILPYQKALLVQKTLEPLCYALFLALCAAACRFSGFNLSLCVILFYVLCCMLCRKA